MATRYRSKAPCTSEFQKDQRTVKLYFDLKEVEQQREKEAKRLAQKLAFLVLDMCDEEMR